MSESDLYPVGLKEERVKRHFEKASATYQDAALLQADIGQRLIREAALNAQSLEGLCANKSNEDRVRWLDIGCGPATLWSSVKDVPRDNLQILGLDLSYKMLCSARESLEGVWVNAHMNHLPFRACSMDALVSCFALHWSSDIRLSFSESIRVLKPNGRFAFAFPIEQSFSELMESWGAVDDFPHVHNFPSSSQLFDSLTQCSVSISSWQETREYLYYESVKQMVLNLRQMGVTNQHPLRQHGLMPKGRWRKFLEAYETKKTKSGKFPLSYRVLWIYGKKL